MSKEIIASGEYLVSIPRSVKESNVLTIPDYANELYKDTKCWYYGTKADIEAILRYLKTKSSESTVNIIWVNTVEFTNGGASIDKYSLIRSTIAINDTTEVITHSFCKKLQNI